MPALEFQGFPYYNHNAGQIDIIKLSTSATATGFVAFGQNERLGLFPSAPNTRGVQMQDSVNITSTDFANTSMLARDMKNSLGKTLAVFKSHYVNNPTLTSLYTGVTIDASVGQFAPYPGAPDATEVTPVVNVYTFAGGVAAGAGFGIVFAVSYLNNVRT